MKDEIRSIESIVRKNNSQKIVSHGTVGLMLELIFVNRHLKNKGKRGNELHVCAISITSINDSAFMSPGLLDIR